MDRKAWIAIILSIAGLVGWQWYYVKTYGNRTTQKTTAAPSATPAEGAAATEATGTAPAAGGAAAPATTQATPGAPPAATSPAPPNH